MQDGSFALLDRADYESLLARGFSGLMSLQQSLGINYVTLNIGGGVKPKVSRLILQAGPGEAVGYRNGSRLDLRRDNLFIKARRGHYLSPQETALTLFPNDPTAQVAWLVVRSARKAKTQAARKRREAVEYCGEPDAVDAIPVSDCCRGTDSGSNSRARGGGQ